MKNKPIRFLSEKLGNSTGRDYNYQVFHGDDPIGHLIAAFKDGNRNKLWEMPHCTCTYSPLNWKANANLALPFHQAKAMIRRMILDTRFREENPQASLPPTWKLEKHPPIEEIRQFARWCHQDWLSKSPKEQARIRKKIAFRPVSPNTPSKVHNSYGETVDTVLPWRVYESEHSHTYGIFIDNHPVDILREYRETEAGFPVWDFNMKLHTHLGLDWMEQALIPMPFNRCKALIRHVLNHSIPLKDMEAAEILQLAEFAQKQEIASRRIGKGS